MSTLIIKLPDYCDANSFKDAKRDADIVIWRGNIIKNRDGVTGKASPKLQERAIDASKYVRTKVS